MTERPILCTGGEVSAILGGRKTQTRRVVKPDWQSLPPHKINAQCPYGFAGDLLWVREKWLRVAGETWYYATAHEHARTWKWRPSIHMPRWASRITLEVVRVRVERLQAITPADCIAEGCPDELGGEYAVDGMNSRVAWFMYRWDALNAKRAPWSSNPFVWVVEFGLHSWSG